MAFPQTVKEEALVRARRACCVCQEFVGRPTEVHHIIQEADGGSNTLENAIVLCLKCHSDAGHYNPRHPIGNKYSPDELRRHRDNWWAWCEKNPSTPLPKNPIVISPNKISLGAKIWKTRSVVTIYNKSDDIWYQIIIKMTVGAGIVTTDDVDVTLSSLQDEYEIDEDNGLAIHSQIFRIDGTNASGEQIAYLWLYSLDPRETKKIVLASRSKIFIPDYHKPEINLLIHDFSQEPANVSIGPDGRTAIPFQAPEENFKLKHFVLLMRKTKH